MKTLKNSIALIVISFLMSIGCIAQNSITGTIVNYKNGESSLSSFDMISGDNMVIGNIDKEGKFTIPLDENYLTAIKEKAKIAQENASGGSQIKFKTVATTFECFGGELEYKNSEAIITGIPDPEVTGKNGKAVSVLYAVNQPEIAQWLYSYGQKNSVKGYYLQWFFVEDLASVKGECRIPTYAGDGEEDYNNITITNLELQKGWNIIKYNITEVFTDATNRTSPSKTEITCITEIPADVLWTTIIIE